MSNDNRAYVMGKAVEAFDAFDASIKSGRPIMIAVRLQRSFESSKAAHAAAGDYPNLRIYLGGVVDEVDDLRRHHVELGVVPDATLREIFDPWPGGSDDS